MKKYFIIASLIILNQLSMAQNQVEEDKKYSLFNAVPKEKMRSMQTDRPDITESPYSVDAGHFQYETDLFKTIRNEQSGILNVQNVYNHANMKLGITNTTDIQLVIESLVENTTINNISAGSTGFGDVTFRIKQNLWGNDNGNTAFAVMPYINFPTSQFSESGNTEGGIIFPLGVGLKNGFALGTQIQFDLVKGAGDTKYSTEALYSITINRGLSSKVDAFIESYTTYNFKTEQHRLSVNGGLGFSITQNFKLDAGFNYGITKGADKVYFTGLSFRY